MAAAQALLTALRSEAAPALEDIAATPFFQAVARRELPLECYIQYLRAMKALIQTCTPSTTLPALSRLLSAVERDLEILGAHHTADYPRVTLATLSLTEQVRARYLDHPAKLVGYLCILLETTFFEKLDPEVLAAQLGLPQENGFSFLGSFGNPGADLWSDFPQEYSSSLSDEAAEANASSTALSTAAGLKKLFQALYPLEIEQYGNLVMDLNPSAGTHAIPDNPREIQAAIRAGEVTLKQIPYYEWRYGDRGKNFAHSDSAWLAAVTRLSDSAFAQQIDWLARLLAPRGMPQWLLEKHLRNLHAELLRFCPENAEQYEKIAKVVKKKRSDREMTLAEDDFSQLAEEFEDRVKHEWPKMSRNVGKILVAAVSDEALGINNAVASVQVWMTDPSRFSSEWIAAVEATLQAARARVQVK